MHISKCQVSTILEFGDTVKAVVIANDGHFVKLRFEDDCSGMHGNYRISVLEMDNRWQIIGIDS